jgi:hypothetical protein
MVTITKCSTVFHTEHHDVPPNESSGQHSCSVFGRYWVQISARGPATLIEVYVGFLSTSSQMSDSTLHLATTASFNTLSNSSFTYHTFIRHLVWVTEKASLNKLQIQIPWLPGAPQTGQFWGIWVALCRPTLYSTCGKFIYLSYYVNDVKKH